MTPEERRKIVDDLEMMIGNARVVLDINLKQLRREQAEGSKRDPLVTSLTLVDGTLANAERGLQTIAKWEAE